MVRSILRVHWILVMFLLFCVTDDIGAAKEPAPGGLPPSMAMVRKSQSGLVLLVRQDVAQDLELIPSQEEAVRAMIANLPNQLKTLVVEFRALPEGQRRERVAEFGRQLQAEVDDLLLPHQRERLAQITLQIRINAPDVVGSFVSDEAIQVLGLSQSQVSLLRSRRHELNKMYRNQIAEVRKRVTAVMLAELTPEQRAEWNTKVGEPFIEDPGFEMSDIESAFTTDRRDRDPNPSKESAR